ncbi:hypothetical protein Acsp03_66410 [Actinomadura sp. NBRC 104412]|uniref:hypothetical protein n=1 Tax=Actinomadura sp. NBRC 104412 TaxID=3032203 RepID=UPI0024A07751|nr:hypothetical protein [Actinomadura sp. NBRC 104412]GLZ09175.1 hypothetical protein Acsp03_66410 [Actinomadura sp. NBRC 104412]
MADASVDLVLCSHLLFTWAGVHVRDWHRTAILELCRVSRARGEDIEAGLRRLLDTADVLLDGTPAPDHLVHVRVTPFGCDGPRGSRQGTDLVVALGGMLAQVGDPGGPPLSLPLVHMGCGEPIGFRRRAKRVPDRAERIPRRREPRAQDPHTRLKPRITTDQTLISVQCHRTVRPAR